MISTSRYSSHVSSLPKGCLAVGGALLLSAIALPTKAATFNVEYAGSVSAINRYNPCTFAKCISAFPVDYNSSVDSFDSRKFGTVAIGDRITGSYLFDDVSNTIPADQFKIAGSQPADTTFETATGDTNKASFSNFRRVGFDPAVADSLTGDRKALYLSRFTAERESLNLNEAFPLSTIDFDLPFTYEEGVRGQPAPGQLVLDFTAFGNLDEFTVTETSMPTTPVTPTMPSSPTADVPEPATLLGLLTLAGLGLCGGYRRDRKTLQP